MSENMQTKPAKTTHQIRVSWPKNVIHAEISQCLFKVTPVTDPMASFAAY